MDPTELFRANLLSPMVLAFGLGVVASLLKSDLRFPADLYTALSIYLLLAIGLKGGAELSETPFSLVWRSALAALLLGMAIPLWSYAAARWLGRMSVADAAALAAHYGSVSAVTFIATQTFLESLAVPFEGYAPALVALLEVPAILVALLIARRRLGHSRGRTGNLPQAIREILTGRSLLLLLGGLAIGFLSGTSGLEQVSPLFVDPFRGALTLFLLELGMVAAQRLGDLRRSGVFLLGFGILLPVFHGALGVLAGFLAGMSPGGATILGVLAASASYIAAPAAVRLALPEANPGYYLTASLAITFPFNLVFGIPLCFALSRLLYGIPA